MGPSQSILDRLVPPQEMLHDGTSSPEEFIKFGEGFLGHVLRSRAYFAADGAMLDIGCGNGSLSRALTSYLSPAGRYAGVDVNANTVAWLQERYAPFPNFSFAHANVYNKLYNPSGTVAGGDYQFPFSDQSFDLVLLKSVFTHMVPADVRKYLAEIARVLRPGGRSVITYFLLNDESRRFIAAGRSAWTLEFPLDSDPLCRIADPQMPESVVAHDEARIRAYNTDAGFSLWEVAYGNWCGRKSAGGFQDVMIALKE